MSRTNNASHSTTWVTEFKVFKPPGGNYDRMHINRTFYREIQIATER